MLKKAILLLDEEVSEKFEREIAVVRSLRHLNVIFFYGCGARADGTPFLVTEYATRGSLRKCLSDRGNCKLDASRRLSFALDACKGMEFLHSLIPVRLHR